MVEVQAERRDIERLERQLRAVVASLTPELTESVAIGEVGGQVTISLPEPWGSATRDFLTPLDLIQNKQEGLTTRRDHLWRVVRHLELAMPESDRLRRKIEEGTVEPLPGLIRFGAVSRAMPLPHWEKLSEQERARVRAEEREAQHRARRWAEELRTVGGKQLARFRERLG